MQISSGSCDVTNGSAQVVASAENDWIDAQVALQYGTPVYFSLVGTTEIPRQVTAVTPPQSSASGNWELTLIEPWDGDTLTEQKYIIHKDFTVNLHLAQPAAGDRQWAQIYSRNQEILDAVFASGSISFNGLSAGVIVYVAAGKTMYVSGELEIPATAELDILEGGAVEIG